MESHFTVDNGPVIQNCEDVSASVGLNIGGAIVSWIEPTATSNSGVVSVLSRSHAPGQFFVIGSTSVTYIFVDSIGQTAECTFNVGVTEGEIVVFFVFFFPVAFFFNQIT